MSREPCDLLTEDQKKRVDYLTSERGRLTAEQHAIDVLLDELTSEVLLAAIKQYKWRLVSWGDGLEPVGAEADAFIDLIHTLQNLGYHDSFYLPLRLPGQTKLRDTFLYVRVDDGALCLDIHLTIGEYPKCVGELQAAGISVDLTTMLTRHWRSQEQDLEYELEKIQRKLETVRAKIADFQPNKESPCESPSSPPSSSAEPSEA